MENTWYQVKPVLFVVCLIPLVRWVYLYSTHQLGLDPFLWLMESAGETSFFLLCFTLMITPIRQITGQAGIVVWRRMLGLFAFFYACIHLFIWAGAERHFSFALMGQGVVERPAIVLGLSAFVLMVALALTSSHGMMRKLGRNWRRLHQLVYVIGVLAAWHFILMQRPEDTHWAIEGAVLMAALLLWRIVAYFLRQQRLQKQMANIRPEER